MFEFEVVQEINPNTEILEIIKDGTSITKNGKGKHLLKQIYNSLNQLNT